MRYLLLLSVFFLSVPELVAQQTGTAYGMKGGLTIGTQSWNGGERDPLFAYNGSLFLESVNDSISLSFFGQLGYAAKGSAIVSNSFYNPQTMVTTPRRIYRQPFNQVSLIIGARNLHRLTESINGYYALGLRGDYLVSYELAFSNIDDYVNKFNYGVTLGGGLEFHFADSPIALQFEIQFHNDLSKQIFFENITVVDRNGNIRTQSQNVVNRAIDITLGFKFIRRVEWVDAWDDDVSLPTESMRYARR